MKEAKQAQTSSSQPGISAEPDGAIPSTSAQASGSAYPDEEMTSSEPEKSQDVEEVEMETDIDELVRRREQQERTLIQAMRDVMAEAGNNDEVGNESCHTNELHRYHAKRCLKALAIKPKE